MDNSDKLRNQTGDPDKQNCDCESNCCPPKKTSILPKMIFSVVLLAAMGVILVKLFFTSAPTPASNQQVFRNPDSPAWSDSTQSKCCDTTKGTSCCPK